MTVTQRVVPMVLALFSVAVLEACGGSPPPPPPAPAVDTAAERRAREEAAERERAAAEAAARAARQRAVDDSIARVRAAEEEARRASESLRNALTMVINFDFDQSNLRDDARAALDAKLPILMANPTVMIRVSGHADERGSSEYNLALGQRRAATAKRYLVERGVAESRIETTSFGEERPVCTDSSEGCWMQNRRDEFEITAGGPMLTRPQN